MAYTRYDIDIGDLILSGFTDHKKEINFSAWAKVIDQPYDNDHYLRADILISTIFCSNETANKIVTAQNKEKDLDLRFRLVPVFYKNIQEVFKKRNSNTYPIGMSNFIIFGKERLAFI